MKKTNVILILTAIVLTIIAGLGLAGLLGAFSSTTPPAQVVQTVVVPSAAMQLAGQERISSNANNTSLSLSSQRDNNVENNILNDEVRELSDFIENNNIPTLSPANYIENSNEARYINEEYRIKIGSFKSALFKNINNVCNSENDLSERERTIDRLNQLFNTQHIHLIRELYYWNTNELSTINVEKDSRSRQLEQFNSNIFNICYLARNYTRGNTTEEIMQIRKRQLRRDCEKSNLSYDDLGNKIVIELPDAKMILPIEENLFNNATPFYNEREAHPFSNKMPLLKLDLKEMTRDEKLFYLEFKRRNCVGSKLILKSVSGIGAEISPKEFVPEEMINAKELFLIHFTFAIPGEQLTFSSKNVASQIVFLQYLLYNRNLISSEALKKLSMGQYTNQNNMSLPALGYKYSETNNTNDARYNEIEDVLNNIDQDEDQSVREALKTYILEKTESTNNQDFNEMPEMIFKILTDDGVAGSSDRSQILSQFVPGQYRRTLSGDTNGQLFVEDTSYYPFCEQYYCPKNFSSMYSSSLFRLLSNNDAVVSPLYSIMLKEVLDGSNITRGALKNLQQAYKSFDESTSPNAGLYKNYASLLALRNSFANLSFMGNNIARYNRLYENFDNTHNPHNLSKNQKIYHEQYNKLINQVLNIDLIISSLKESIERVRIGTSHRPIRTLLDKLNIYLDGENNPFSQGVLMDINYAIIKFEKAANCSLSRINNNMPEDRERMTFNEKLEESMLIRVATISILRNVNEEETREAQKLMSTLMISFEMYNAVFLRQLIENSFKEAISIGCDFFPIYMMYSDEHSTLEEARSDYDNIVEGDNSFIINRFADAAAERLVGYFENISFPIPNESNNTLS